MQTNNKAIEEPIQPILYDFNTLGNIRSFFKNILVVDDNQINRKTLGKILSDRYNIIESDNGKTALSILRENGNNISLVLLDIVMPVMDGYEVLENMRSDISLSNIPVIVISGQDDEDAEIKALTLGANDYILKPYKPIIIRQRVANTIYLRETSIFVNSIQNDKLTGVYSKEYFYVVANEILSANPNKKYDIVCTDIENFKIINDLFGTQMGDQLLKYMANIIKGYVCDHGICGRIGADVFVCLIEHVECYNDNFFCDFQADINKFEINIDINTKHGVYFVDNSDISINVMCDRAKLANQSIKRKYGKYFAYYDDNIRNNILNEQFLTSNLKFALSEKQFVVYYQPKYDLTTEKIAGVEALVRWNHPEKGFLTPGDFIAFFEKNGFITELDVYILNQCCADLRKWIDLGNIPIPLSINVSRADLYNSKFPEVLISTIKSYDLDPTYFHLEITETAYTENPKQLIEIIKKIKKLGFVIEMDDFGSGYSSLNMLSDFPIDVLKLDMRFLQNDDNGYNRRNILSFIISLAKWLDLIVVAEGVETRSQVELLKMLNCDQVQGYYFAKPMPKDKFEKLLLNSGVNSEQTVIQKSKSPRCVNTMVVLDDNSLDYPTLSELFSDEYDMLQVNTEKESFDVINSYKDSICALIINLSCEINSFENLHKECDKYNIPIIIIHNIVNEYIENILKLGAYDYVQRPYNKAVITKRIKNAIYSTKILKLEYEKDLTNAIIQMKKRAEQDSLTGLLNRLEFELRIESFFQNNINAQCIFIILDIDNFKYINDNYGHMTGDKILCIVTELLTSLFPQNVLISRMGGDEFALFVPYIMDDEELCEKLQKICLPMQFGDGKIAFSCSIGACRSNQNINDYSQLYNYADITLLKAKRSGKGQYMICNSLIICEFESATDKNISLLLDNSSDAMFVCDSATSDIIYINETACKLLGVPKDVCMCKKCYELFWNREEKCSRCKKIETCKDCFYLEETFLADEKTPVRIKARVGTWGSSKVKIHYLQLLN